jgi:hypothetical protein
VRRVIVNAFFIFTFSLKILLTMKSLLQMIQQKVGMTLVAVAFMAFFMLSSEQASAQTFQSPAQATATIDAALPGLSASTSKVGGSVSNTPKSTQQTVANPAVNAAGTEGALRVVFLLEVKDNIKQGLDTGAAIDAVYNALTSNNATRQTLLNSVRLYTIDLLN